MLHHRKLTLPPIKDAEESPTGRKVRILIVDDVALCRKLHHRVLKPSCQECVEACDGQEAVERVRESLASGRPFDGILMDSSMPFMKGTEATRLIREMGYGGKIFGVTGNALQSDIDEFMAVGADEVMIKPLSVEQFSRIISEVSSLSDSSSDT